MISSEHRRMLDRCVAIARAGSTTGEIPVGALIKYKNVIIAQEHNLSQVNDNPLAHAEINVINKSLLIIGRNIAQCSLYVTLEPCIMCVGAIQACKIKHVYFGALAIGKEKPYIAQMSTNFYYVPHPACAELLHDFFQSIR